MKTESFEIVTVTLNPAIDRTVKIQNFTAGAVNRVTEDSTRPGGKGVNVASSLADAGHAVCATGFLGERNVTAFDALFTGKKIADRFIRIPGETRVGIKITDPTLRQTTDINFPGIRPTDENLQALEEQLDAIKAEVFVLAGSLPPGVPPDYYRKLVAKLRERGARVVLDTSGEPMKLALEAQPSVFKPNIHELGELLGTEPSTPSGIVNAARRLIGRGIEQVIVSRGRDGACFVSAQEAILAVPPDVEVGSTVGAGDAMVAGIVSAHLQKLSLTECARLATAFSVHALSLYRPHAPFAAAIQSILPQVTTHPLT